MPEIVGIIYRIKNMSILLIFKEPIMIQIEPIVALLYQPFFLNTNHIKKIASCCYKSVLQANVNRLLTYSRYSLGEQ